MFCKKGFLRNFTKFAGKHKCQSQACNFIKKENLARVFSCEFCDISQNTFSQNTSGQLLPHLKNSTFQFKCIEETGILAFPECISIDRNLHVCLSCHGLVVLLLQSFRYEHNCTLARFNMLENSVSYLRRPF